MRRGSSRRSCLGKLDDLRALEKLSDESVPFAMYWWGTLLHHCVFEICDRAAAQALFLRAAKAGHARAQAAVFAVPTSPGEFAKLTAEVGIPKDGYARLIYGIQALLVTGPRHSGPFIPADLLKTDPKARTDFVALACRSGSSGCWWCSWSWRASSARADEVRAVANSGYVLASETVIRGTTGLQMLERVRAGELWLGAACCDTAARKGAKISCLPRYSPSASVRPGRSFPGGVRALLRHHHHTRTSVPRNISPASAMPCWGLIARRTLTRTITIGATKARTSGLSGSCGIAPGAAKPSSLSHCVKTMGNR